MHCRETKGTVQCTLYMYAMHCIERKGTCKVYMYAWYINKRTVQSTCISTGSFCWNDNFYLFAVSSESSNPRTPKVCRTREGVQSIHEPRKLTFRASWLVEWSHSQLLANQIVSEPHATSDRLTSFVSRPAIRYPITNIWLLHQPKAFFFEKSQHVHKVFNGT